MRRPALADARRRFGVAIAIALVAGALIGDAWHLSEPSAPTRLTLPTFHGQGDWAPGQRRAPGFTLRDQTGARASLAAQRGKPVVIAFLAAAGGAGSGPEATSLAQAEALIAGPRRPTVDVISLDQGGDTHETVRAAVGRWGLKAPYRWLTGAPSEVAALEHAYGVTGQRAEGAPLSTPVYLVDRSGFERAGYLYPFFPTVLAGDLERLYREHD